MINVRTEFERTERYSSSTEFRKSASLLLLISVSVHPLRAGITFVDGGTKKKQKTTKMFLRLRPSILTLVNTTGLTNLD